jgi:suppressor of fused-like protein
VQDVPAPTGSGLGPTGVVTIRPAIRLRRRAAAPEGPPGPGTQAIDRRVARLDGGPEVRRYHPRAPHRFQGDGPLKAVTVHRLKAPDHWHLVTYGLSELDAKESDDAEQSGWGFELTMRLAVTSEAEPTWAVDLLTNLAAYVWTTDHGFAAGHHIDLRGPIRLEDQSDLTAAVLVVDPTLGRMRGPFGRLTFLQLVALTADELELCRSWSTDGFVQALTAHDPLLITRLDRRSLLSDPSAAADLLARAGVDGGELSELRVATLALRRRPTSTVIQLGAGASAALGPALRRELIAEGARFSVIGDTGEVRFIVTDQPGWRNGPGRLDLDVPRGEVEGLAALFDGRPGWGRRPAWSGLRWHVVP